MSKRKKIVPDQFPVESSGSHSIPERCTLERDAIDHAREIAEKAFDYRGDVTITFHDGRKLEGYVFDRRIDGPSLEQCLIRVIPVEGTGKILVRCSEISHIEFTGRDTAAGRSFELWLEKVRQRKAGKEPPACGG